MNWANSFREMALAVNNLEKACNEWNFHQYEQNRLKIEKHMERLDKWTQYASQTSNMMRDKQLYLNNNLDNYKEELEKELHKAGLVCEGSFPTYHLPPFVLHISLNNREIRLILGRKVEKTGIFEPQALRAWLVNHYNKIVKRPFNKRIFFKDILESYKIGSVYHFGGLGSGHNIWGKAVSLKLIYKLLTLKTKTRREYPETHFIYDLARLRAEGLVVEQYTIEFGHTRNIQGFVIPDLSSSRQERFSTITIHYNS